MLVCMNISTYMHICVHTYIHTYIHACMHACMHSYIFSRTSKWKETLYKLLRLFPGVSWYPIFVVSDHQKHPRRGLGARSFR